MTVSETLKKEGNSFFAEGDYVSALVKYTEAICANGAQPILYSNRAATFLKLESWENAVLDCERGLNLLTDESNETIKLKLLWRKSIGLRELQRLNEAFEVIQIALKINPNSEYLKNEYSLISQKLKAANSISNTKESSSDQENGEDIIDIEITEVDKIPDEFYTKDGVSTENDKSYIDSYENLESYTSTINSRMNDSHDFPMNPSLQYLLSLQDRFKTDLISCNEYLVRLPVEAYRNIFAVSGIDPEVLNMFLKACIALLEQHKLEYKGEITEKLKLFKTLPRFSLTSVFVDSGLIDQLSKLFRDRLGEDFMSYW